MLEEGVLRGWYVMREGLQQVHLVTPLGVNPKIEGNVNSLIKLSARILLQLYDIRAPTEESK